MPGGQVEEGESLSDAAIREKKMRKFTKNRRIIAIWSQTV